MNENDILSSEVDSELSIESNETDNNDSTNEVVTSEESAPGNSSNHEVDQEELPSSTDEELEQPEEEKPSSTVIQVINDDSQPEGYSISELDVTGLNDFVSAQNESIKSVNPTSNDYYAFIEDDVLEYFKDIMSLYPLNEYKAVHLRHWIQNTQYYSYYDDYYYLWYDYPSQNCVEIVKYNGQANYVVNWTTQYDLTSSIVYGSHQGEADFRKGVSYVQEIALLGAVGCCLVLYILSAFFHALKR